MQVFFGEITYNKNYQQQLKNLYDSQNVKIYASSSSSSLLKDQKAYLTGRQITIEILPIDFEEYLIFKNITIKKRDKNLIESHFIDYLKNGGMPEYVLKPQREYITHLVDDIIQKDIIAFHGIKNKQQIKYLHRPQFLIFFAVPYNTIFLKYLLFFSMTN